MQNLARFANSAHANFKSRLALNFAPDSGTYLSKQNSTSRHHSQNFKQFSCSELRLRTGIDSVRFRNALAASTTLFRKTCGDPAGLVGFGTLTLRIHIPQRVVQPWRFPVSAFQIGISVLGVLGFALAAYAWGLSE